ncbi:MAG: class I SAM-dependent methyltransferase [Actinomycetota bacterium]|nr:class I SAM-dependent methyltransferase [Actinomycetota bacterium]
MPGREEWLHRTQYAKPAALRARTGLHERFSVNREGYLSWLAKLVAAEAGSQILEIGCGTGSLWELLWPRLSHVDHLVVSDISPIMVHQTLGRLGGPGVHGCLADGDALPCRSTSFDTVVGSHVVYHLAQPDRAVADIARVLRAPGVFIAATVGALHLTELRELTGHFFPQVTAWNPADVFGLENAPSVLGAHFADVSVHRYPDALRVTDADAILQYALSWLPPEDQHHESAQELHDAAQLIIDECGSLEVQKDFGVLVARL